MKRSAIVLVLAMLLLPAGEALAKGKAIRVPKDHATIQAAVDAADSGDRIRVQRGAWCGAVLDKPLELIGQGGATIVGCPDGPSLFGILRIGFFLPDGSASGSTIRGFTFDGTGVSNGNFSPLSFAIFARQTDDLEIRHNRVLGTIQAITNTSGSGWSVHHNRIEGLGLLGACGPGEPGLCGGGVGIVFQERAVGGPRQTDNSATHNVITGAIPDGHDAFAMGGIFVLGQQGTVLRNNRLAIPDNPTAEGEGVGIEVSDACCGDDQDFLTSIDWEIVNNDGRDGEFAVVVTLDSSGGTGNTQGGVLRGNFGINDINGVTSDVENRSIKTLIEFP